MIRQLALLGALLSSISAGTLVAQHETPGGMLGRVELPRKVMAGGAPLAAGAYDVRITGEVAQPALGQSTDGERWVEFFRDGRCVARELATVVSNADIGSIAKGPRAEPGRPRVEMLKGEQYVRVWINRNGYHYIINMPVAA